MAVKIELDVQEGGGEPATTQGRGDGSNGTYVYYLGMVVVVIGFVSCVMQLQFHGTQIITILWALLQFFAFCR